MAGGHYPIPPGFIERMERMLGKEFPPFFEALEDHPPVSIHLHPRKSIGLQLFGECLSIPWYPLGRYLLQRPSFTLDPFFHGGAYYVQEASSMVLAPILQKLISDIKQPVVVDLCAAPGGKSTLILGQLEGQGLLISNEVIHSRVPALKHNLIKWGYSNQIITSSDPEKFGQLSPLADILVVDAPCSGEGLFRKDPASRSEWSEIKVDSCAARQHRILNDVLPCLKTGGYLIYSTCTYNPQENEHQIKQLLLKGYEQVKMDDLLTYGFQSTADYAGYQSYPHKVKGEGFFISVLRKTNLQENPSSFKASKSLEEVDIPIAYRAFLQDAVFSCIKHQDSYFVLPPTAISILSILQQSLHIKQAGINIGSLLKNEIIPDHQLAQSLVISPDVPSINCEFDQAISYLRKNSLPNEWNVKGLHLVQYNKISLGWAKGIPGRLNNLFPMAYRILQS